MPLKSINNIILKYTKEYMYKHISKISGAFGRLAEIQKYGATGENRTHKLEYRYHITRGDTIH